MTRLWRREQFSLAPERQVDVFRRPLPPPVVPTGCPRGIGIGRHPRRTGKQRRRWRAQNQAASKGVDRQLKPIRELEFVQDRRQMIARCRFADEQSFADVFVSQPFGHQFDDLTLTRRQAGDSRGLGLRLRRRVRHWTTRAICARSSQSSPAWTFCTAFTRT